MGTVLGEPVLGNVTYIYVLMHLKKVRLEEPLITFTILKNHPVVNDETTNKFVINIFVNYSYFEELLIN